MSRFLNVLRSWLVMVSVIAAGNTLQSFRDHGFLSEKLYTASPGLVNGLQARTFGVWTLLSSVIRCLCAIDIRNRTPDNACDFQCAIEHAALFSSQLLPREILHLTSLYHITLFTFFLALAHFLSEVFIYHTAALTIGVMAPLMVASFSIMGMLIGLQYLEVEALSQNKKKK
ncbi:ergosterol biosynthetic protein 28 homolog precursor [Taeniopygia guttata]|uniref:Ergosterol biosynthesis 28 homolog n=1 Tax=Taeniopygia guttata TaxID=59729 RepID=B5G3Q9_TAEGU|nr:ergosterol biosynthetic protein 28 homolog precursor [Taeniopygia guttata]ACH45920.1 putative HSPC288 variant 2 [Taeniopygia guttata]